MSFAKSCRNLLRARHRDTLSERVQRTLIGTLYSQPASLAIGATTGVLSSSVTALVSGHPLIIWASLLLTIIVVCRVSAAVSLAPTEGRRSVRQLELFYKVGAYSYALVFGTIAAMTLVLQVAPELQVLMVANTVGYGISICARNAGRPAIALNQLTMATAPVLIACLTIGTLPYYALAATILLLIPAMASITFNVFKVLRDSIGSAETSARLAERMRRLARTDVVTNLANRAGHNHDLAERMTEVAEGEMLALFWLDLDRFKEVNDLLGHPVGDRVLREVADRLREVAPENAAISRFGGDEFIMFCTVQDRKDSERLASELHQQIMRPMRVDTERLEVNASIGIALLPEDGTDADTLMQNADLALYHAKANGRKQSCFYDATMSRDLARRREIEAELRAAIQKDELSIYFQPIVDLETGRIRTFEALVRWFHPIKGELSPQEFIPVAEETGVIITLGNWITAQAAKAAAQWPDDVTIAVNLSPLQIKAPGAALGIVNALREAGLEPSRLELEVTESLFVDDNSATETFVEELSAIGVRFALDDFGTGYSSLGYIQRYPFSKIKVDRSFVSGPKVGRKTDAIIHAVAELGSKLEMDIVAEGLETVEQVQTVRAAGCTLGQGYYFSRAVPDYMAAMLLTKEDDDRAAVGSPLSHKQRAVG
ncbi:MAG: EAL domain-containing protein [Pontixanthobacter sp.]